MTKKVLPILEAHAGGTKPAAKTILQIMNVYLFKVRGLSDPASGAVQHPYYWLAIVSEHMGRIFPVAYIHH